MLKEIEIIDLSDVDKHFYSTCLRSMELKEYDYVAEVCRAIIGRNRICLEVNKLHLMAVREVYKRLSWVEKIVQRMMSYFFLIMGSIYLFLKKYDKAWDCTVYCLHSYPLNRWALSCVSKLGVQRQLKNLTMWGLEELGKVQPENLQIKQKMGQLYLEMGLFDKALKIGESILEKAPFDIDGLQLVQNAAVSIGLATINGVKP